jgi:hypothetical protein
MNDKPQAYTRENERCVFTDRHMDTDKDDLEWAAYIYPSHLLKDHYYDSPQEAAELTAFWSTLGSFWPGRKIEDWKLELVNRGVESPGNIITMSHDALAHWRFGRFAIKPVETSDDKLKMIVQLFWQKKCEADENGRIHLLSVPPSTRDIRPTNTQDESFCGMQRTMKRREASETVRQPPDWIASRDKFMIKTSDPEESPLPNKKLLELHFFMSRIVGLAGMAEREGAGEKTSEGSGSST